MNKFEIWCEEMIVVKGLNRRNIHYFAELVYVNGGTTNIKEVNRIKHDPGSPYQRQGLTGPEALILATYAGIAKGFCLSDVVKDEDVVKAIKDELDRDMGLTIEVYDSIPKRLIIPGS